MEERELWTGRQGYEHSRVALGDISAMTTGDSVPWEGRASVVIALLHSSSTIRHLV